MTEPDVLGMLGFHRLRAGDARREQGRKKPRRRFRNEAGPGMKP